MPSFRVPSPMGNIQNALTHKWLDTSSSMCVVALLWERYTDGSFSSELSLFRCWRLAYTLSLLWVAAAAAILSAGNMMDASIHFLPCVVIVWLQRCCAQEYSISIVMLLMLLSLKDPEMRIDFWHRESRGSEHEKHNGIGIPRAVLKPIFIHRLMCMCVYILWPIISV